MENKFYLVNCVEFPDCINVNDEIKLRRVENINAAYHNGNFVGSVSENIYSANCKILLIGTNVSRNMKLLVEAA